MTLDQCAEIVGKVFAPRWARVGEDWNGDYIRTVIYPQVRTFSAEVAERAAAQLAAESRYVPSPAEWKHACQQTAPAETTAPVRLPCPHCQGAGRLSFTARRDEQGGMDEASILHPLDPTADYGAGRYGYVVGCGCENTQKGEAKPRLARAVRNVLGMFEQSHGWQDGPASPDAWGRLIAQATGIGALPEPATKRYDW